MAKAGFWLKGARGSLAGSVVANSPQGTIIREKVIPSNPKTESQVSQRSKFKLMSQLASQLAQSIAIPKRKGLTSRNIFIKNNFESVIESNNMASVILPNIQLTDSKKGLQQIQVSREINEGVVTNSWVRLADDDLAEPLSRVVYNVYVKNSEGALVYADSKVVEFNGDPSFHTPISLPNSGDCIVYAFGARDLGASVSAKYHNMKVQNGADFASLIFSRTISTTDMALTQTRGAELRVGDTEALFIPSGYAGIYASSRPANAVEFNFTDDAGQPITNHLVRVDDGLDYEIIADTPYVITKFTDFSGQLGIIDLPAKGVVRLGGGIMHVEKTLDIVVETKLRKVETEFAAIVYSNSTPRKVLTGYIPNSEMYDAHGVYTNGTQITVGAPSEITANGVTYVFKGWTKGFSKVGPLPTENDWYTRQTVCQAVATDKVDEEDIPAGYVEYLAWYEVSE